jgi:hypothetical protein
MPFKVVKSDQCPPSKPWACITSETGKKHGCHASRGEALKQARALYKNVPEAREKATAEQWQELMDAVLAEYASETE